MLAFPRESWKFRQGNKGRGMADANVKPCELQLLSGVVHRRRFRNWYKGGHGWRTVRGTASGSQMSRLWK